LKREFKFAGGGRERNPGGDVGLQRTFRRILFASFGLHIIVFLGVTIGPLNNSKPRPPEFYKVKLVAGRPGGKSAARSSPAVAPAAAPARSAPTPAKVAEAKAPAKKAVAPTKTAKVAPPAREQAAKKAAPAPAAAAKKAAEPAPAPASAVGEADDAGEDDILGALGAARQQVGTAGGDRGSGGGSGGGTGSGDGATARDLYHARIWSRIKRAWSLPEGLAATGIDLSAIVVIRIGRDGRLIDKFIEDGSGNRTFDQSAMRAVARSTPFPSFPAAIGEREMEIGLRFKSSEY
jgi:colicin import membrane protein